MPTTMKKATKKTTKTTKEQALPKQPQQLTAYFDWVEQVDGETFVLGLWLSPGSRMEVTITLGCQEEREMLQGVIESLYLEWDDEEEEEGPELR